MPMKKSLQEIEVKFFINNLKALEGKLRALNATLVNERVHELNYRFDTPDHKLTQNMQVLRLRKDKSASMTYKSGADPASEVSSRQEIEFKVGDFDTAKLFLQALGYQVSIVYEKYRAVYQLDDCAIMLDELPFGDFLEIEGADSAAIKKTAALLQLDWEKRIKLSYLAIFFKAKEKYKLQANNLVFKEVEQSQIPMEDFLSSLTNAR
jgi:adenylate cyclase, class 2